MISNIECVIERQILDEVIIQCASVNNTLNIGFVVIMGSWDAPNLPYLIEDEILQ